jgi:hypothetical protein
LKLPILNHTILRDFENCPHKCFRRHIKRDIRFVRTPAMDTGSADHKALENRLKGKAELPGHLRFAEPLCQMLYTLPSTLPLRVEYRIAMRIDGSPCAWDAQGAFVRTLADVAVLCPQEGWLIDWKTGKRWEDPFELELQAMLAHAHHPEIVKWTGQYYWLREQEIGEANELKPMDTFAIVGRIYGEMFAMAQNGDWPKKKNKLCGWCDVKDCENYTGGK